MDLRPLLPAFATHLAARAAADRTRTSYRRSVAAFLKLLPERDATRADIENFLARPRRDGSPRGASTKRAELMALRAFFRFIVAEGVVTDPTAGIRVKRERRAEPAVAMPLDIGPLYEAAIGSAAPAKNVAILALLQVFGLRVHELALLDAAQIDLGAGVLRQVRGKGGTVTDFPMPPAVATILSSWLRERRMLGHDEGPLFPTARPSSSATGRFSIRSLQRLVNRLAEHAGLGRRLGPHALRHGCATAAIMAGVDLPTVQRAMRHENLATTSLYSHVAYDARRDAFEHVAALIPRAVLPRERPGTRNPSGNPPDDGVQAPVDIHPA